MASQLLGLAFAAPTLAPVPAWYVLGMTLPPGYECMLLVGVWYMICSRYMDIRSRVRSNGDINWTNNNCDVAPDEPVPLQASSTCLFHRWDFTNLDT